MKVRGVTVLTRKAIVTREFGADAWAGLFRDIAGAHPVFAAPITASSLIPAASYLAFHDELVRRFCGDGEAAHHELGKRSAEWALREGPYKAFMDKADIGELVASFPKLWDMYFADTTSRSEATFDGTTIDFKVFDLPQPHPYFESFIVGYMKEVLELYCANPITASRVHGGGRDYHYVLAMTPSLSSEAVADAGRDRGDEVSDREMEVLRLVAKGMTNREIGLALGISGKTVQHHVGSAYGKLGVSGRVGATVWLARRGLIGR